MKWAEQIAHMGDKRAAYRGLGGRPKGKSHLEDLRGNTEMDLQEVGCGGMDWLDLAQDRDRWRELVNMVMYLQIP